MSKANPADESRLVRQAQQGDRNAYSELIRMHAQGVQRVVYRMCGDQDLAEDAAQDTFIQAWLKLSSYKPDSSLRNWLYRIAVNTTIDTLRREKRILPDDVDELPLADTEFGPETAYIHAERTAAVHKAIAALPDASRAVLILREYEDLSYREIAETLDIPLGTVMSRLSYARKLLKEELAHHLEVVYA